MCKKLGVTALVIVGALFLLHKLDLLGYGRMAWHRVQKEAKDAVPPEIKLERLKDEISQISPDMNKIRSRMAAEQVEIEKLARKIKLAKESAADQEKAIANVKTKLDEGHVFVTDTGKELRKDEVERQLASQWEVLKDAKTAIKANEEVLEARKNSFELAKAKLAQLKTKREEMEAKVAQLEAELRKVRLAQTKADIRIDDPQLDQISKHLQEVADQIEKEKVELDMQKAEVSQTQVVKTVEERLKVEKALAEMDKAFNQNRVVEKTKK
jgi:chromosome segregation ATPase